MFVAPIPLLWALEEDAGKGHRRSFVLGWLAAFAHFIGVLHWILGLPNDEVTIPGIMIPGLLFMSAYLAVFFGVATAVAAWLARRLRAPIGLVWAVCVTLADYGRSIGELAFPWGSAAYALKGQTAMLQMSAWTGFWGLAFWTALSGGVLYHLLRAGKRTRLLWALLALLLLTLPLAHGLRILSRADHGGVDEEAGIDLVLIQPNTSREIKWDPRYREIVIQDLLDRTRRAGERDPDLIIWPETAAPILLLQEPVYLSWVQNTVADLGIPLLAGTLDHRSEGSASVSHNSAALFDSTGRIGERYDKQKLVPFSERMPFQKSLPWLSGLNFGQSDFTPGDRCVLFNLGETKFGCLICFESIFPELARTYGADGSGFLVNITNDFWFGDTAAPVQHADMAIFRAVETRMPLVRCANTGISMVVDRYGRVSHQTETFVEAFVDVRVTPSTGTSFYTRHGEWWIRLLAGLLGAMILSACLLGWGGRR